MNDGLVNNPGQPIKGLKPVMLRLFVAAAAVMIVAFALQTLPQCGEFGGRIVTISVYIRA
jgi:hypothetical protein